MNSSTWLTDEAIWELRQKQPVAFKTLVSDLHVWGAHYGKVPGTTMAVLADRKGIQLVSGDLTDFDAAWASQDFYDVAATQPWDPAFRGLVNEPY